MVASAPDYFVYRGRPRGFLLDLAENLARSWERRLQIVIAEDSVQAMDWLESGTVDIAALGSPWYRESNKNLVHGPALEHTDSVLITRSAEEPKSIAALAQTPAARDLVARCVPPCKQVLIPRPKSAWSLLKDFQAQRIASEGLLASRRYAEAAVAMYPELQLREGAGASRPVYWWLNTRDRDLLGDLEAFFGNFKMRQLYPVVRVRYYGQPRWMRLRARRRVRSDLGGITTPWDGLLRRAAKARNLDWRLLAAIILRESGQNPLAVSSAGAEGPLQLMPATAKELGVQDSRDPAQSIPGAARYLNGLMDRYRRAASPEDQRLMALAAYNVGPGHVDDARRLAKQLDLDRNRWWGGVALTLPLLKKSAYGKSAAHGSCQGLVAVDYAEDVEMLYDQYLQVLPEVLEEKDGGPP